LGIKFLRDPLLVTYDTPLLFVPSLALPAIHSKTLLVTIAASFERSQTNRACVYFSVA